MLRSAINKNENYDAEISIGKFQVSTDVDLVVLHDWFSTQAQMNVYEKLRSSGVPMLLVAGDNFNGRLFNSGSQDIKFSTTGRGNNAALPLVNGNFEYFELESDLATNIKKWPPLKAPFGKWKGYLPSDVLLFQQIGSVATQEPLVMLTTNNKSRLGVISGTGVWQWRMADFEQNENMDAINAVVSKVVQSSNL